MKFFRTKSALLLCTLAITIVVAGIVIWNVSQHEDGETSPHGQSSSQNLITINGYQSTNYIGTEIVARISAEQLKLAPRRAGVFRLRLYDQFEAKKVRVECILQGLEKQPNFMAFPEFEKIPRGRISDEMTLSFFDGKKATLLVTASSVEINLKNNSMKLEKAIFEQASSQIKIAGKLAFWDGNTKSFLIPDQFLVETTNGNYLGKEISIDPYFRLSKDISSLSPKSAIQPEAR